MPVRSGGKNKEGIYSSIFQLIIRNFFWACGSTNTYEPDFLSRSLHEKATAARSDYAVARRAALEESGMHPYLCDGIK